MVVGGAGIRRCRLTHRHRLTKVGGGGGVVVVVAVVLVLVVVGCG